MRRHRAAFRRKRSASTVEYLLVALQIATATFAVLALVAVSAFD